MDARDCYRNAKFHGFTLVELLVVIAIIAVLGSIFIPKYQDFNRRAMLNLAVQQLENDRSALERYYGRYKKHPKQINGLVLGQKDQSGKFSRGDPNNGVRGYNGVATAATQRIDISVSLIARKFGAQSDLGLVLSGQPKNGRMHWACGPTDEASKLRLIALGSPSSCMKNGISSWTP